jgi:hypothetical protein
MSVYSSQIFSTGNELAMSTGDIDINMPTHSLYQRTSQQTISNTWSELFKGKSVYKCVERFCRWKCRV